MNNLERTIPIINIILGAMGTITLGLLLWGVKVAISSLFDNTVAVKVLTAKIEDLVKGYEKIPKIEKDVSEAHDKIRQIMRGDI